MAIAIHPLQTDEEFQRYEAFSEEVYGADPHWVRRPAGQLVALISGRAPRCRTLDVQPFWAEQDGKVAAAATAVIDREYIRRWEERLGHLVAFEALPDCGRAVESLVAAIKEWFQQRGVEAIRASYLGGWQMPLTIDAYDTPATAFHSHNPPYYHNYLKNAGFETEKGMVEYQLPLTEELASRHREIVAEAERKGVNLRCWDAGSLEADAVLFGEVMNEAFSTTWGIGPIPLDHFRGLKSKWITVPEFQVLAEVDGEPAGCVSSPPNLNQALLAARQGGFDESSPEYEKAWENIDHGVLLVIGVKKEFRERGIAAAMAAKSYLAMHERGYKLASYTPVLDDNWPSRRTAEKVGGSVVRNFVIYRSNLNNRAGIEGRRSSSSPAG